MVPPSGLELPGINYKFNTKKYRYFYGSRVELSPHPYKVKTLQHRKHARVEHTCTTNEGQTKRQEPTK